jgi:hypothetical protein
VIRFVGAAYPLYDFSETADEQSIAPRLPDGSLFTGVPSESAVLFSVTADPGGHRLRSGTFVLNPGNDVEAGLFARLKECIAELNPDGTVHCTQCGVSIVSSEPLCSRYGARQSSIESVIADLENLESRLKLQVAAQDAVMATRSFQEAIKTIASRPLTLTPDRPSPLRYIFLQNRIWTTRENMSDEEFKALAQDDLDRKQARKQSAVERHQERVTEPVPLREDLAATVDASYQTAPLTDYRDSLQRQAEDLFSEIKESAGERAKRYDGSYSILARGGATAAKIVIYQRGLGHENGVLPFSQDGIYILVRTSGKAGTAIWNSRIVHTLGFAARLNPESTVGIAPAHDVRFAYFGVADEDAPSRIAELLVKCSIVR